MTLTKNDKAIAINLAMHLELGVVYPNEVLKAINKNTKAWLPVLEFWGESCELTRNALDRLFAQKCFNNPSVKGVN